jgi:hypothetical protein
MFAMRTTVLALVMCPGACPAMQPFGTHSQSQRNVSVTMVELPAPTGPFSIGTKIYNWEDRSRRELASKNPADSRQLIVQVWYPTEDHIKKVLGFKHWDRRRVLGPMGSNGNVHPNCTSVLHSPW